MHDLPGLEHARVATLPDGGAAQGVHRAVRRHVALLLLTMSVVVIPNVVAFAASIME